MSEKIVSGKGIIKIGSVISQDFCYNIKWPECLPPLKEYEGEQYQYICKDAYKIFDVKWDGSKWICTANGYGQLSLEDKKSEYGNGSIFVYNYNDVVILPS